tara:strand:+ start:84 stop:569 length:486 start_codon:yes stop_codon:yes gene_type:complete
MKLLLKINREGSEDFLKSKYRQESTAEANLTRSERGDAGLDLYFPEDIKLEPNKTTMVDLGIACEGLSDSDDRNVSYYLHCRSSISKTPLRLANNVGIIDAGYRGNIMVAIDNRSNDMYSVQRGQRLFQICGRYLEPVSLEVVGELSDSMRGNDGFGSTGS